MAILSALLSLIVRELSTIIQAIFGWSITALFGKLPSKKQAALSVALGMSVAWPFLAVGCFAPGAAAWAFAFIPMHKWLGATALRVVWIALAVLVPLGVGAITRWITPPEKLRGGLVITLLGGYPMTIGYFTAFVVTAVTVPIVKLMSAVHRWEDCHVYVQPKEGKYFDVLDALAEACARAGAKVVREDVPAPMALANTVVQKLAQPFLEPIVASKPQRLRGEHLEVYLYPADLLLRGEARTLAHVRAAMTRTDLERDSYLVTEPEAQKLQDEIQKLWEERDRAREEAHGEGRRGEKLDLAELSHRLDRANVSFDEWMTLEAGLRRLERAIAGAPDLLKAGSDDASGAFRRGTVSAGRARLGERERPMADSNRVSSRGR